MFSEKCQCFYIVICCSHPPSNKSNCSTCSQNIASSLAIFFHLLVHKRNYACTLIRKYFFYSLICNYSSSNKVFVHRVQKILPDSLAFIFKQKYLNNKFRSYCPITYAFCICTGFVFFFIWSIQLSSKQGNNTACSQNIARSHIFTRIDITVSWQLINNCSSEYFCWFDRQLSFIRSTYKLLTRFWCPAYLDILFKLYSKVQGAEFCKSHRWISGWSLLLLRSLFHPLFSGYTVRHLGGLFTFINFTLDCTMYIWNSLYSSVWFAQLHFFTCIRYNVSYCILFYNLFFLTRWHFTVRFTYLHFFSCTE